MYHSLLSPSPTEGCLGSFQFSANLNKMAANTMYRFLCGHTCLFLWDKNPRVTSGLYDKCIFSILRACQTIS